jgi:rhodanese-related sulfurtransferase
MRLRLAHSIVLSFALACATAAPAPVRPSLAEVCTDPTLADAPALPRVDGATARKLVAEGARLVDVRAPDFYGREHIAGAINIPVAEVAARAPVDIGPPSTPVVLYCRTGAGSAKAAATLRNLGYVAVYDLGSYLNWGEGAPAPTPLPPARTN